MIRNHIGQGEHMKETINLGGIEFKHKKDIIKHITSMFNKHGRGLVIRGGHEYFDFFYDLLLRHPNYVEKTKMGCSGFRFGSNDLHKHVELQILAHDSYGDAFTVFSWRDAVSGKVKQENLLLEAMREAIGPQILHFRNLNPYPKECPLCSKSFDFYHVDHRIKFRELVAQFLCDYTPPTEFKKEDRCKAEFRDEDIEFSSSWQDFHAQYAEYWYLCQSCNIKDKHPSKGFPS